MEIAEHTCDVVKIKLESYPNADTGVINLIVTGGISRFCKLCDRILPLTDFCKDNSAKFGYSYRCKECQRKCNIEQKDNRRKYYQKRRAEDPKYLEIIRKAKYKYNHSAKGRQASRDNHDKFKESELIYGCKYYREHRQHRINYTKQWRLNNPQKVKQYARKSMANRKNNPLFNLADRLRISMRKLWTKRVGIKSDKTFNLLGYTQQELFDHLSNFVGQLCCRCGKIIITINNSHIDHIIPQMSARTKNEVISINALSNLRLICIQCNLAKGARYE